MTTTIRIALKWGSIVWMIASLTGPAFSQDTAKEVATVESQIASMLQEFKAAQTEFLSALRSASGIEEQKWLEAQNPTREFARRFMEIADQNRKNAASAQALVWVASHVNRFDSSEVATWTEAVDALTEHHIRRDALEPLLLLLADSWSPKGEKLLRQAIAESPHRKVQGKARLGLARFLVRKSQLAEILQRTDNENDAAQLLDFIGRDWAQELRTFKPGQATSEAEGLLEEISENFADVANYPTTLGRTAEGELYELKHLAVGKVAPDIEGEDVDGKAMKLSDFRGKVAVVVFWGFWCGPCRAMLPQERALVKTYENQPFVLLGVNSDQDRERTQGLLEKAQITWRCWWDGGGLYGPIATQWNVRAWPEIYVIDQQGLIRFKGVRGRKLDDAVESLLTPRLP